MKDEKKTVWAWAFYDWANSAFATTVMAGFFPLFFKKFWAVNLSFEKSTFYLGTANSLSAVIIAVLAPFLGAAADKGSMKKKMLLRFAFLGIVNTFSLFAVSEGKWLPALLLYFTAYAGFAGGNLFYDSLITDVASVKKRDFVSSLGFALGYIGGGILFLINVLMYLKPSFFGIPDSTTAVCIAFISVACWWGVFTLPLILFVKEPKNKFPLSFIDSFRSGWKQLKDTLINIKQYKQAILFLIAYWFYIDGVYTIIKMAVDYGASMNFPAGSLITALLLVQFVAFPAALIYGWIGVRIGVKTALLIGIIAYCFITIFGFVMQEIWQFYAIAVLVGLFQGGIQALSRSLFARLIPDDKSGEFFGFYNMLGKFAAVLGPFMIGMVALLSGSNRYGILSLIVLFAAGALILTRVDSSRTT